MLVFGGVIKGSAQVAISVCVDVWCSFACFACVGVVCYYHCAGPLVLLLMGFALTAALPNKMHVIGALMPTCCSMRLGKGGSRVACGVRMSCSFALGPAGSECSAVPLDSTQIR